MALNAKRAAEEAAGTVRWLRPEFQARAGGAQVGLDVAVKAEDDTAPAAASAAPVFRRPWPAGLPEQIKAVAELLAASPQPLALADLETRFQARGRWRERLPMIWTRWAARGRLRLTLRARSRAGRRLDIGPVVERMEIGFGSWRVADDGTAACSDVPRISPGDTRQGLMLRRSALRSDCTAVLAPGSRR